LTDWTLQEISDSVWSRDNLLTSMNEQNDGKYLSSSIIYRGRDIASAEIEQIATKYLDKNDDHFVEWIPDNIKTAMITLKPLNVECEATMIGNITSVKDCFQRIWENFHKLFEKKAFLHWYKGEGMHEMEFVDAESEIKDLIMEYFEKQEISIDFEDIGPRMVSIMYEEDETENEQQTEYESGIESDQKEQETPILKFQPSPGENNQIILQEASDFVPQFSLSDNT